MGLLGKYAAYRWLSAGDPGGGGGGGLAVLALLFGALLGGLLVLNFVVTSIVDAIFAYVRPIFMLEPTIVSAFAGLAIAATVARLPKYDPDTAESILAPNGRSAVFYVKAALLVAFLNLYVYGLLIDFRMTIRASDHPVVGSWLFYAAWTMAILYWLYTFVHLPYRYVRLVRHAPTGYRDSTLFLLPLTTAVVVTLLQLPTVYADSALGFAIVVNSSFVLGAAAVKVRAEPRILGRSRRVRSDAATAGSAAGGVEGDGTDPDSEDAPDPANSAGSKPSFYRS